jgi:hypothetical protein
MSDQLGNIYASLLFCSCYPHGNADIQALDELKCFTDPQFQGSRFSWASGVHRNQGEPSRVCRIKHNHCLGGSEMNVVCVWLLTGDLLQSVILILLRLETIVHGEEVIVVKAAGAIVLESVTVC